MKKFLLPLILILCFLCACSTQKTDGNLTATVTVDCADVLAHPELLKAEKASVVPDDGVFLNTTVSFREGETVYDVLLRALQSEKLHYEADSTKYILGIGNLYSGDCGELSGWLYTVNGESPIVGSSKYILEEDAEIRYYYVTDFTKQM